jgi:predicted metalloprotease
MRGKGGLLALLAVLVLSGCGSTVPGTASASFGDVDPGNVAGLPVRDGPSGPKDTDDATLPVRGGTDDPDDLLSVNAISDVIDYWRAEMPKTFGKQFSPLRELVSYDSAGTPVRICGGSSKGLINAFYCPSGDSIGWDRGRLIPFVRKQFGDLSVVSIFAHEMGHAVQYRLSAQTGVTRSTPTIVKEQQADCFAGAFFRSVAEGKAKHFAMSTGEGLNQVLATMLFIRDEPGDGSFDEKGAHGSAFDRIYALQAGFGEGPLRCSKIDYSEIYQRRTQLQFNAQELAQNNGNLPIDPQAIALLQESLDRGFRQQPGSGPRIVAAGGKCPDGTGTVPASYCPAQNIVSIDLARLEKVASPPSEGATPGGESANNGIGDFAAFAEIASRYAIGIQHRLGIPTTDNRAGLRTACLSGAWAATTRTRSGGGTQLRLATGDLDEAVAELLAPRSVMSADADGRNVPSGFARVEAFRTGFMRGSPACTSTFR